MQPWNDELIQAGYCYAIEHQDTLINAIAAALDAQRERDAKVVRDAMRKFAVAIRKRKVGE